MANTANTRGTLVLHGGALCDHFYGTVRRTAGVDKPRLAVFLSAHSSFKEAHESFFQTYCPRFSAWGFEPVFVPVAVDHYTTIAHDESYANLVKSCQAVFLGGGSQANHARSLLDDDGSLTPVAQAIKYVYEHGGVVAGNSAGTHVISNPMYSDGSSYEAMCANAIEPRSIRDVPARVDPIISKNNISLPGLGLVNSDILLCTHHDARGRLGRLIVGVRDLRARYGVGIDEETTLVLAPHAHIRAGAEDLRSLGGLIGEVVGYCGVFIVEVIPETVYAPAGRAGSFGVSNLRLHYLTEGDRFDFSSRQVIPGPDKRKVAHSREADAFEIDDIFSQGEAKYRVTRAIVTLANSGVGRVDALVSPPGGPVENGPAFRVTISKDDKTEVYASGEPYGESRSARHLEGLKKVTASSTRVDVIPILK